MMQPDAGSAVLYKSAEPFETALADTAVEGITAPRPELIYENWDPYKVQTRNLAYLRAALGATLWDDKWSEGHKRGWLAQQWEFKARRGTERGIRMALDAFGFDLIQLVTPPQGFYASPKIDKDVYDAWVRLMPELRILHHDIPGVLGPNEFIAGPRIPLVPQENYPSFADEDAVAQQDGPFLYGRKAILRHRGVDTPLKYSSWTYMTAGGTLAVAERVSTVGHSSAGFFADFSCAAPLDFAFAGAEDEATPVIYTTERNVDYQDFGSALTLSTLVPTLTPFTPRMEHDSDVGQAGAFFFAGDFAGPNQARAPSYGPMFDPDLFDPSLFDVSEVGPPAPSEGSGIAGQDEGGLLLADRVYLLDRDVTTPMTQGWSFASVDRAGMPSFTAELLVALNMRDELPAFYAGEDCFAGDSYAMLEDMRARNQALDAVVAAGALRDRLLVDTAPKRLLTFGDPITEETTFGEWATAPL